MRTGISNFKTKSALLALKPNKSIPTYLNIKFICLHDAGIYIYIYRRSQHVVIQYVRFIVHLLDKNISIILYLIWRYNFFNIDKKSESHKNIYINLDTQIFVYVFHDIEPKKDL